MRSLLACTSFESLLIMNFNHPIIISIFIIVINHIMISSSCRGLTTHIEILVIILLNDIVMSDPLLLLLLQLMMIELHTDFKIIENPYKGSQLI
jgi:hypothetical protein